MQPLPPARPRFKPYPTYRDSGVEWLGEIPAHWKVRRLKTITSVQLSNVDKKSLEGQQPVSLCNYTDVYYHERITADLDFMSATASPEQVHRFTLRADDVLITKDSESWTDIAVPAVVAEDLYQECFAGTTSLTSGRNGSVTVHFLHAPSARSVHEISFK